MRNRTETTAPALRGVLAAVLALCAALLPPVGAGASTGPPAHCWRTDAAPCWVLCETQEVRRGPDGYSRILTVLSAHPDPACKEGPRRRGDREPRVPACSPQPSARQ